MLHLSHNKLGIARSGFQSIFQANNFFLKVFGSDFVGSNTICQSQTSTFPFSGIYKSTNQLTKLITNPDRSSQIPKSVPCCDVFVVVVFVVDVFFCGHICCVCLCFGRLCLGHCYCCCLQYHHHPPHHHHHQLPIPRKRQDVLYITQGGQPNTDSQIQTDGHHNMQNQPALSLFE